MNRAVPTSQGTFSLGDWTLQSGAVLRDARLSWKTFGTLSAQRDNVIVYPTSFAAQHADIEWLVAADGILDPTRWFIVIPDMFGNGLSSSPSNDAVVSRARDGRRQRRGAAAIPEATCSPSSTSPASTAGRWARSRRTTGPRSFRIRSSVPIVCCGSARTAPHNRVFLEGLRAILEAAPEYGGAGRFRAKPEAALRAFGRVYAGWALSQEFYREHLYQSAFGAPDLEAFLAANWNGRFAVRDAANLMAHLATWQAADISQRAHGGDLAMALNGIRARVLLMPGEHRPLLSRRRQRARARPPA